MGAVKNVEIGDYWCLTERHTSGKTLMNIRYDSNGQDSVQFKNRIILVGEWSLDELWRRHPFSGHCHLSRRHFHEKFLPWWRSIVSSRLEIVRSWEEIDTTMSQHKWPHLRWHRCSYHPRFDKLQFGDVFKTNRLILTQLSLHTSWLLHYLLPRTIFLCFLIS